MVLRSQRGGLRVVCRGVEGCRNASAGPLFHVGINDFKARTATLYQLQTRVDRTTGSYRYDCVGSVSYALKQAPLQPHDHVIKSQLQALSLCIIT